MARLTGTGFTLRDPLPFPAYAALTRLGEELGYAGVFLPEIAARDAFAALTALAGETRSLLLGTGVVTIVARRTVVTAMGAATVQERSGGRHVLGLGTGPATPGALERLRAEVLALRGLLAGEPVDRDRLSLRVDAPPIWIAALGPRATRLAGEVADGVLLNWCTPERVTAARAEVRAGAEAAGRDPDAVTIAVYVRACVDQDAAAASAALADAAAAYASYPAYARQFAAWGLGDAAPTELAQALCLAGEP
ncbi:MAG: LLM class flavin-dependent oxidoreductase, partial [Actinomycetota bacterium]